MGDTHVSITNARFKITKTGSRVTFKTLKKSAYDIEVKKNITSALIFRLVRTYLRYM